MTTSPYWAAALSETNAIKNLSLKLPVYVAECLQADKTASIQGDGHFCSCIKVTTNDRHCNLERMSNFHNSVIGPWCQKLFSLCDPEQRAPKETAFADVNLGK
ncbi:hypothetical protein M513_11004 [Trichuris suis]|uniref:Uncharacterized protein n=1 Tax=Trichuris suis TaxID=68888 RepID=A0A085LT27_9BILA|nr:hypothetical protein M513_11004 [Trichuris suis]